VGTPSWAPSGARGVAARLLLLASYGALWWAAYTFINAHGADPARAIRFTRPCDVVPGVIQPWTAVVYVFGGLALPLLPFYYNWRWPQFRFVLTAYAVSAALAFVCYWVWPVNIVRPPFDGPGLGNWLMRQVVSADGDANCIPSSHVTYAVLAAILVGHGGAGRPIRVLTWALAAAVCATTVTTGQHYLLDVAGGGAAAVLGYVIARWLLPGRGAGVTGVLSAS
jgi:membrane-associated phospholipid phosphatase